MAEASSNNNLIPVYFVVTTKDRSKPLHCAAGPYSDAVEAENVAANLRNRRPDESYLYGVARAMLETVPHKDLT